MVLTGALHEFRGEIVVRLENPLTQTKSGYFRPMLSISRQMKKVVLRSTGFSFLVVIICC
jgi:hypothetical protein